MINKTFKTRCTSRLSKVLIIGRLYAICYRCSKKDLRKNQTGGDERETTHTNHSINRCTLHPFVCFHTFNGHFSCHAPFCMLALWVSPTYHLVDYLNNVTNGNTCLFRWQNTSFLMFSCFWIHQCVLLDYCTTVFSAKRLMTGFSTFHWSCFFNRAIQENWTCWMYSRGVLRVI